MKKETNQNQKMKGKAGIYLRNPHLILSKGLESTLGFIAPITGALSVGANPDYGFLGKVFNGSYEAGKAIYNGISAYATNQGIRDFTRDTFAGVGELLANSAENIIDKPLETAVVALTSYGLMKGLQYLGKSVRERTVEKKRIQG